MDIAVTPTKTRAAPDPVWQRRALRTLFGFAVALLFGALICFVAWNWAYLGTGLKLGGLGGLLVAVTALWVWRGLDTRAGVVLGLLAQLLIGIWLAAAAQIYQAPGGLPDLTYRWAMLGLPFALASRSWAHWAMWLGVVGVTLSGTPEALRDWLGDPDDGFRFLFGTVAFLAAGGAAWRWKGPDWFSGAAALIAGSCALSFAAYNLFDYMPDDAPLVLTSYLPPLLSAGTCAVGLWLSLQDRRRAAASIFASFTALCLGLLGAEIVGDTLRWDIAGAFVLLLIAGGLTYALVRVFGKIASETAEADAAEPLDDDDGAAWYMDAVVALGGILTASAAIGLIGLLLNLLNISDTVLLRLVGAFGFLLWLGSLIIRRREPGTFLRFVLDTTIMLGGIGAIIGFGAEWESEIIMAIAALVLIVPTAAAVPRDRVLHVFLAGGAVAAIAVLLVELGGMSHDTSILTGFAVYAAIGIALTTERIAGRRRLLPATIFLLSALCLAVLFDLDSQSSEFAMLPRIIDIGVLLLGLAWTLARLGRNTLPSWPVVIVLAVIACLLPLGAGAAVLILLLGYALRSRAMFGLGVITAAWFLFAAYYDLSLTLLELSGTFAATGALLFGLWYVAERRLEAMA